LGAAVGSVTVSPHPPMAEPTPTTTATTIEDRAIMPVRKGTPSPLKGKPAITRRPMTQARRDAFLKSLREHGVFMAAARDASPNCSTIAGPSQSFKDLMARDDVFRQEVEAAIEEANAKVELEIHRRAVEGYEEPVFYMGEVVGSIRKWSDRLLELRAKGALPDKYAPERNMRMTSELTTTTIAAGSLVLSVNDLELLSDDEARQLTDLLQLIETRRHVGTIEHIEHRPVLGASGT
jgi:hypothetical protein